MRLHKISVNETEIHHADRDVFYSYNTAVVVRLDGHGWLRTDKRWSVTTSRHINRYVPNTATVERVPQDTIDRLADGGSYASV